MTVHDIVSPPNVCQSETSKQVARIRAKEKRHPSRSFAAPRRKDAATPAKGRFKPIFEPASGRSDTWHHLSTMVSAAPHIQGRKWLNFAAIVVSLLVVKSAFGLVNDVLAPSDISPLAPIFGSNFTDTAADWINLFEAGRLSAVSEHGWNITLTSRDTLQNLVPDPLLPVFNLTPDARIPVLPNIEAPEEDKNISWIAFWSSASSYRTMAGSPFAEAQLKTEPDPMGPVEMPIQAWDDHGRYLNSVFRLNETTMVSFFHAEQLWSPDITPVWKSIGVTYSQDNGVSWSAGEQIITSGPQPATPQFGGAGDHCVIWDPFNKLWLCYYTSGGICLAASNDPEGAPGTWFKWNGTEFTAPGIAPSNASDYPLTSIDDVLGSNPSVHWNTLLQRWVMVYASWPADLFITTSTDGFEWQKPLEIVAPPGDGTSARYPTIISSQGDLVSGKFAKLYYAYQYNATDQTVRDFVVRDVTFVRNNVTNYTSECTSCIEVQSIIPGQD
ncbi:hypothetical protein WJX73_002088 [Symbiochloris irregularis]|uniref:Uncharacterized protein n=1 Tax=Symbiochloris irregularis TaxID=706552 RepID=A0AAW1NUE0_9CHLO